MAEKAPLTMKDIAKEFGISVATVSRALKDSPRISAERRAAIQKYARDEDRPEKTMFIITTDGMENASHQYTFNKVKAMVERQKERFGWEFLFLGANIDAIEAAGHIGIHADRAVTYQNDEAGTALNYEVMEEAIHHVRCCSEPLGASWKRRIDEDAKRRSRKN